MSRFYDIAIPGAGYHWTSHPSGPGGQRDPGALNVEIDINAVAGDTPMGQGFVRVWGVGLQVIAQANKLANQPITVKGGMGAGLPLSNPAQAGIIAQGRINQFFGNWEGVNQSIDLMITAGGYGLLTTPTPGPNPVPPSLNGTLDWKKGQPLAGPLKQTLQQMFPGAQINMAISSNIVAPQDQQGYYGNLYELATYIRRVSQMILANGAMGVSIIPFGNTVTVDDGSSPRTGGQINYQDLIGQPTWIDINTIEVKCVMRADIRPAQTITLPSNVAVLGALTLGATARSAVSVQGSFYVTKVRHVGNFRQPDGSAWATIITASAQTNASAQNTTGTVG